MPPRKVGSQLRAEQMGIAPGKDESPPLPLKTVHPEFPVRNILDFIEKDQARAAVDFIQSSE